jgi:lipopolysaccharide transport system permease protein
VTAPLPALSRNVADVVRGLNKLYRYRDLLWQMIGTDLRGRYAGSALGVFWNVIHPLVMIGIYLLIFSQLIGARLAERAEVPFAFGIYLCAGLLPWNSFAEIVRRSTGVFLENGNLVKKIAFPNVLLHLYVAGTAAVHTVIVIVLFGIVLIFLGHLPPIEALALWLVLVALQLVLATGLGLITSTLNVFFRDVGQITAIALQIWFWLTPIVYTMDILPAPARAVLRFNVMTHFARSQQELILEGGLPAPGVMAGLAALAVAALLVGVVFYAALRHRIPDEL